MKLSAALVSSLRRVYPGSRLVARAAAPLRVARGGTCSLQAAFVLAHDRPAEVACRVHADGLIARVRRVGHVPMPHFNAGTDPRLRDGRGAVPGFVPDPLFDEATARFAVGESNAFWITLSATPDAKPGKHAVRIELAPAGGKTVTLRASVNVAATTLPERRDFPITHWFHVDCLCDRYRVDPYGDAFWPLCEAYLRDYVAHGCDCLYVPAFAPPLDGVRKPAQQLLIVRRAGASWRFDWSRVERWIELARRCGIRWFEWSHLFTQWGAAKAIRIYESRADGSPDPQHPLWDPETPATSDTYRSFLAAYLPELERFVRQHGLLERSFFHLSDEPHEAHAANYRAARALLRELAPWMRIMDALSDLRFAAEGLTDIPVPILNSVPAFATAGIPCWSYYCCVPQGRFLNRELDTPLPWVAMHGFLLHRLGSRGFLHWGYNYWYRSQTTELIDPFVVADGAAWPGWAYGDTSVVYPGPAGPIDSIRWEIFGEAMQDLSLLRAQEVPRDARWLSRVRAFDDFPRDERWVTEARARLLGSRA